MDYKKVLKNLALDLIRQMDDYIFVAEMKKNVSVEIINGEEHSIGELLIQPMKKQDVLEKLATDYYLEEIRLADSPLGMCLTIAKEEPTN